MIELPEGVEIASTTMLESKVEWEVGSGESVSYVSGSETVSLVQVASGEERVVAVNRWGVIR